MNRNDEYARRTRGADNASAARPALRPNPRAADSRPGAAPVYEGRTVYGASRPRTDGAAYRRDAYSPRPAAPGRAAGRDYDDDTYYSAPRRPVNRAATARARRSRRRRRTARNVLLTLLALAAVAMVAVLCLKGGLPGGDPLSGLLGAVPTAGTPFDDVFATAAPQDTPSPTALVTVIPTAIPTIAPTRAPTPEPTTPPRTLDPDRKAIALTFDDGPSKYTREILDTLAEVDGRATFFVVGERLDQYSDTLKLIHESGCQIGMHTYDHPNLTKLSTSKIRSQIDRTQELIAEHTGARSTLLRPPYGSVNSKVKETVEQPLIHWSVDTLDWESRNADSVYKEIMNTVQDGDIILMHDLYSTTAEAVRRAVPELVRQGYQLCTIDELFELKGISLKAGKVYYSAR